METHLNVCVNVLSYALYRTHLRNAFLIFRGAAADCGVALNVVGALPLVKLNEGRLFGSKATAGVVAGELKLNPPVDAGVDDIPPKLKPPDVAAAGAVGPKLNPVLDDGVDENDDVA